MRFSRILAIVGICCLMATFTAEAAGNGQKMNTAPEGFVALFNGEDLTGWKGLVGDGNPYKRMAMDPEELAGAQDEADQIMREHWTVKDGMLVFDGAKVNSHLCTLKDYGDFEMLVDWRINAEGDSGIYLRGYPQVQIWDPAQWPEGSGGLYNNQEGPREPLKCADRPIGEWNTFRIKMVGDRVTVYLNGELVVDNVVLENYWERGRPIEKTGQIELQVHGTPLYFRNIYIREIPREEGSTQSDSSPDSSVAWVALFNGKDLSGWEIVGPQNSWGVENGILYTSGQGGGWISTEREYEDFRLELEFKVPPGGNSGIFMRAPREGDPAWEGFEVQVLDDYAEKYRDLKPWQFAGSVYGLEPPSQRASKKAGEWQKVEITLEGLHVKVVLNDVKIVDSDLALHIGQPMEDGRKKEERSRGLLRTKGYIGLQNHGDRVEFRNMQIQDLSL